MTTSSQYHGPVIITLALVAVLVLTGCSSSDDSSPKASPSPDPTASIDENAACTYLTAAERKALAGVALDTVVAADARTGGNQCRWSSDQGLIQLTSVPSPAWAKTLPQVVANIEKSTDQGSASDVKDLAAAKKLIAGADSFTGKQACDAFSTLAVLGGGRKGATTTISYLPISQTEIGVSAQTCSGDVLTSIVYSKPGLVESKNFDAPITAALTAAHQRAVADK